MSRLETQLAQAQAALAQAGPSADTRSELAEQVSHLQSELEMAQVGVTGMWTHAAGWWQRLGWALVVHGSCCPADSRQLAGVDKTIGV